MAEQHLSATNNAGTAIHPHIHIGVSASTAAAAMQESDEKLAANSKRPRSPPAITRTAIHADSNTSQPQHMHVEEQQQRQQLEPPAKSIEKKRKTSFHEQQPAQESAYSHSDHIAQQHQQHEHEHEHEGLDDSFVQDGAPTQNPVFQQSTAGLPTLPSASSSSTWTSPSSHAPSSIVPVMHSKPSKAAVFNPGSLENINNRSSAELLISNRGSTGTRSASSSTTSTPNSSTSASISVSSSSSLKAAEDSYYDLLGGYLEHFDRNDSALVWLSRALPTRSNKLAVPKTCRNPKSAGGNGGYADAFKKLGLTLKESDTRSGHWHCWYLDPFVTNFRALQAALKRRWEDSPNYSVSAADLCKIVDDNFRTRTMPLRRQSQPNIPMQAHYFQTATDSESAHYAGLSSALHAHGHGHYPYYMHSSGMITQIPQQHAYYPVSIPMQMQMHAAPMPMFSRPPHVSPYPGAHYRPTSSMHAYGPPGWQATHGGYAVNEELSAAQNSMDVQHMSRDFASQQQHQARLLPQPNPQLTSEDASLIASHNAALALPLAQHQQQLQPHSLHPLSAPVRSSSDSAPHMQRHHPHSNSAQSGLPGVPAMPWMSGSAHVHGSAALSTNLPHSTVSSSPAYTHSEAASSSSGQVHDSLAPSSAALDYPPMSSHSLPFNMTSTTVQQPLPFMTAPSAIDMPVPPSALAGSALSNPLRRVRTHRPALSASSSLVSEHAGIAPHLSGNPSSTSAAYQSHG